MQSIVQVGAWAIYKTKNVEVCNRLQNLTTRTRRKLHTMEFIETAQVIHYNLKCFVHTVNRHLQEAMDDNV